MTMRQDRVLIVDADETRRQGLAGDLTRLGYEVTALPALPEAVDDLAGAPAVALFAAGLLQAAGGPGEAVPWLDRLPVIVLAERDSSLDVEQILAAGAEDFVTLPAPAEFLALRTRAAIARHSARQRASADRRRIRQLEKQTEDLTQVILPLGVALSAEKDFDRLLERILLEAKAICNADAGTLYLPVEEGDALGFAMMHTTSLGIALGGTTGRRINLPPLPLHDPETGQPNLKNVATHVALDGHSVNIPDIYAADAFDFSGTRTFDRQNNYRSISNLTVPLKDYDGRVIGVLQLLNAQDAETGQVVAFDSYSQQVVESLASQAAVALTNQALLERQKKLVKIERDMEIARQIQADFLPSELHQPEGWEVAARFYPAREVAGDFYDVFQLPSGHLCLVVADVCDKGVGAALFMALIRSLMRAFSEDAPTHGLASAGSASLADTSSRTGRQLAAVIANLKTLNTVVLTNDYLVRNHLQANMFATMFFGVLDPNSGLLTYVNGGHNPPIIRRVDGELEHLNPTGPAVGMFAGTNFVFSQVTLNPGDTLFAFTDGITEARDPAGAFFTEAPLSEMLSSPVTSAGTLTAQVETRLRAHIATADQYDDITMLALRRKN